MVSEKLHQIATQMEQNRLNVGVEGVITILTGMKKGNNLRNEVINE